jgi:cytidylate kinase|tara:strand:- start:87 stop:668 length:582 start_codon:yes stop_codon:yes gene_type:complete
MKRSKIILIDGMPTSGKSTTSYNLAKKLPGWIFIDIWRIKDIFEPLGYSTDLDKKEADELMEISKEFTTKLTREVIRKTQRNIILQETTTKYAKKKLGKDLRKYNYQIFTIQLKVPFEEAVKRNKKREKPDLNFFKIWTKERWDNKIQRKIKKGDIVVDTFENNQEEVVKIILGGVGEKAKKHPYEKLVRKFW